MVLHTLLIHFFPVEGVNADFSVPTPMRSLFGQDPPPFSVSVTVRSDGVALEPAEGFVLRLAPINMIAMNILAEGMPGVIARPEISVVIRDLDSKKMYKIVNSPVP